MWSNGPIGLPPYEVLRLGSPANTGGLRGARAGPSSLRVTNGKGKGRCLGLATNGIKKKKAWLAEQAFFAEADEKEYLVCYLKENETKTSKSRDVIIRTATNAFENALLRIASRTQHSADIHAKHYKKNKLKTKANRVACLKELFSKCDEYVLRKASEVDVNDLSE